MSTAPNLDLTSIENYLAGELASPVKHEYLGGVLYAMAGARNTHNRIASNALIALGSRLRGGACEAFNSDTKIRIRLPHHIRFYYPDLSVVCRPGPPHGSFQDEPAVVVEVLSRATRRVDEGEKKDAYLTIPSLEVYLLVEQDLPAVVAFHRTEQGFVRDVYRSLEEIVPLPGIGIELPLSELYERVEFAPEPEGTEP
ncbi:Uma2 family endonuclease [bacterium CPR1]|nr:Uma2 family endonuclease [bacterium CPR1]